MAQTQAQAQAQAQVASAQEAVRLYPDVDSLKRAFLTGALSAETYAEAVTLVAQRKSTPAVRLLAMRPVRAGERARGGAGNAVVQPRVEFDFGTDESKPSKSYAIQTQHLRLMLASIADVQDCINIAES